MAFTTLTDASAVNTLAEFLGAQPQPGRTLPTQQEARKAFLVLVTSAHTKLAAGISPRSAPEAWTAILARLTDVDTTERTGVPVDQHGSTA